MLRGGESKSLSFQDVIEALPEVDHVRGTGYSREIDLTDNAKATGWIATSTSGVKVNVHIGEESSVYFEHSRETQNFSKASSSSAGIQATTQGGRTVSAEASHKHDTSETTIKGIIGITPKIYALAECDTQKQCNIGVGYNFNENQAIEVLAGNKPVEGNPSLQVGDNIQVRTTVSRF